MTGLDLGVFGGYMVLLFLMGLLLSKQVTSAHDMFAAGNKVPWWMSGISAYMTNFSAGTFVVWGGVAYSFGLVAVSYSMLTGIAALVVGRFLAERWRDTEATSAAEFIGLRYGKSALQIYTWVGMISRIIGVAVALYSIAVMITALTPISPEHFLADPKTGNLSVTWAIVIAGIIVVGYTIAGGLWAVLMTDILQFIVLSCSVLVVLPLLYMHVGDASIIIERLPSTFASLTSEKFSAVFFALSILGGITLGGHWAFVQRAMCVKTPKDAKKAYYLFGIMYLATPIIWMLPPIIFRAIDSGADPEQAYILATQLVLPAGLLGLMVAAMFSATASMTDSELNVYAGALTREIYGKMIRPNASEAELLTVGRLITCVLGALVIGVAVAIPYSGGAERVVLTAANLLGGPLAIPTVWGALSRHINISAIWRTIIFSFIASVTLKFGLSSGGILTDTFPAISMWIENNLLESEWMAGTLVPVLVMSYMEWKGRRSQVVDKGWHAVMELSQERKVLAAKRKVQENSQEEEAGLGNHILLGGFTGIIAVMMFLIGLVNPEDQAILVSFSFLLGMLSLGMIFYQKVIPARLLEA